MAILFQSFLILRLVSLENLAPDYQVIFYQKVNFSPHFLDF